MAETIRLRQFENTKFNPYGRTAIFDEVPHEQVKILIDIPSLKKQIINIIYESVLTSLDGRETYCLYISLNMRKFHKSAKSRLNY